MSQRNLKALIVQSTYYSDIISMMRESVIKELESASFGYYLVNVPGVYELPATIKLMMAKNKKEVFSGAIALGCVIRGETDHYEYICRESSRALMDLSLSGIALGFGILTCETYSQALERADINGKNKGKEAAIACLSMIELKDKYGPTLYPPIEQ